MDPQPLVKKNFSNPDLLPTFRFAFQESLRKPVCSNDDEKYILKNDVDEDLKLKQNAMYVVQTYGNHDDMVNTIDSAAQDLMTQQGLYYIQKDYLEHTVHLRESVQLKRGELFRKLKRNFVTDFGLLEYANLLPNKLEQLLDFRYNKEAVCERCRMKTHHEHVGVERRSMEAPMKRKIQTKEDTKKIVNENHMLFQVIPKSVEFHNCELGKTYKRTLTLINTSSTLQSLMVKSMPKHMRWISVNMDIKSKIAPGMSVMATVTFKPELYLNFEDAIVFRNNQGYPITVDIKTTRDYPRLITCIFKCVPSVTYRALPGGGNFHEPRREALNSTIDCGACLVSQYIFLTIVIENKGMRGKFFIITEDDWFHKDIVSVSSNMELSNDSFWIYPTYFEIDTNDICELNLIFQPMRTGLQVETIYLICDNNSFEQIELMGDSLEFSMQFVHVDVENEMSIEEKENYCVFLGSVEKTDEKALQITVHNRSVLNLNCTWQFQKVDQSKEVNNIPESWIKVSSNTRDLAPFSATEFVFHFTFETEVTGYHNIIFSLFVRDIPLMCLEEKQEFLVKETDTLDSKTLSHPVDVLIAAFEIACFIDNPVKIEEAVTCNCGDRCELLPRIPKIKFSYPFLNFGILPTGLNIQKKFYIQNLTEEEIDWRIIEVRYRIDQTPQIQILEYEHLQYNCGKLNSTLQAQENYYEIIDQKAVSWVSFLVLFSVEDGKLQEIESISPVIYEIIDSNIVIETGHSTSPILCPLKLVYVGMPVTLTFSITNKSPITGCFYFLNPYGEDTGKMLLSLKPISGVLKPYETISITATLICAEIGIFEKYFVPCFVGMGGDPIIMRVLCAVDGVHIFFFLPDKKGSYKKVMWPPKVIYQYENVWSYCGCDEEENCWDLPDYLPLDLSNPEMKSSTQEVSATFNNDEKISTDDVSSHLSTPSSSEENPIAEVLRKEFGDDLMLQEDIVEVQVQTRTPTKISIYMENITPIKTSFVIEAQNFYASRRFQTTQTKELFKTEETKWDNIIATEYGIAVLPNIDEADISGLGTVKIDIWIYANIWGFYNEEILIDIPEVVTFSFSLLIEAIGCPVKFPMFLNSLLERPVLRLGHLSYNSEPIYRKISISNSSSIPIKIIWRTFMRTEEYLNETTKTPFNFLFDIVDEEHWSGKGRTDITANYHGMEVSGLCDVVPDETDIMANQTSFINVMMKPHYFQNHKEGTDIKCLVLGHIYLEEIYRKKLNYFWRGTGPNINEVQLEVLTTLEYPTVNLDKSSMYDETRLIIYANEVIFENIHDHYQQLRIQNKFRSPCKVTIDIQEPFFIRNRKNKMCQRETFFVEPMKFLEITISCHVDYQKILELANFIFGGTTPENFIYCVDKMNHSIDLKKMCKVIQNDCLEEYFPIYLFIYYPKIRVKPDEVNFDTVLVGATKKYMISIYNQTGYPVKFEICKSKSALEFFIAPHYGTVEKSTGIHEAFVDIQIYFTPRESRAYHEAMKVVTNIPNYFIEVFLKGRGTVNEKFYIDHKY